MYPPRISPRPILGEQTLSSVQVPTKRVGASPPFLNHTDVRASRSTSKKGLRVVINLEKEV